MAPEATLPHGDVNVPGDYFSLAGFEVIMHGRFWVLTEAGARKTIITSEAIKEYYPPVYAPSGTIGDLNLPYVTNQLISVFTMPFSRFWTLNY